MSRNRRSCPTHHNINPNPAEDICTLLKPPNCNKTWLESSLRITLTALVLFLMYIIYTLQQKLDNIEDYSSQTRRGLWEVSREQRKVMEYLEAIDRRFLEVERRVKSMEDREMNIDVGEIDYALDGKVLTVGSLENETNLTTDGGWLKCCKTFSKAAQTILSPSNFPGDCWSVEIENAIATIELTSEIFVRGITLEHLHHSKSQSGKTTSAPKFFSMWGVKQNKETDCLGSFVYDNQGPAVQTFPVKDHSNKSYKVVKLQVFTNHGNPDYTCIYRIRVHGVPSSGENTLKNVDK